MSASSKSFRVSVEPAPSFPLHVEAGKRHLVDAQGKAFLLHGDAASSLLVQLTRELAEQYLNDRKARGFNAILVNLLEHQFATTAPNNAYGEGPFTTPGDFGTPNEAYFAHAHQVLSLAAQRGMVVLLAPAYMGYGGGSEGWYQQMAANGEAKLRSYGQYIATRFSSLDNLLWIQGGDYNPPELALLRAVAQGIADVKPLALQSFQGERATSALGFLGGGESWLNVNSLYTHEYDLVTNAFLEYGRASMPFVLLKARYEETNSGTGQLPRAQAWQAMLSGACGQLMGNDAIWPFGANWQASLASPASASLGQLRALLSSLAWWTLVPDVGNTFLTSGVGTASSRAVAATSAAGDFALVYIPGSRQVTLELPRLAGPRVQARWFDPTNGAYTSAGAPQSATAAASYFPPGNNSFGGGDWALRLDSVA